MLENAKQGDSLIVKGYLLIELGSSHTLIVLWCSVELHNLDFSFRSLKGYRKNSTFFVFYIMFS